MRGVAWAAALVVPLVLLTAVPVAHASMVATGLTVSLSFGAAQAEPSNFWGMDLSSSHGPGPDPGTMLGTTPTSVLIYPAANDTETTNLTTGDIAAVGIVEHSSVTLQQFIADCAAISCRAIITLPMEINDPNTDAYEARYIVDTLQFHPAYFLYGNEPAHWSCFGLSWTELEAGHPCNTGNTTITKFANETETVLRAVAAALGPATPPAMCLGGSGTPGPAHETAWIHGLLANAYDRQACVAYAMHSHPAYENTGTPTLANFYGTLQEPNGLAAGYQNASKTTDGAPLFMTEVGPFTPHSVYLPPFMGTWAMDIFDSALVVQAMQNRVPDLGWWAWSTGASDGLYHNGSTPLLEIITGAFAHLQDSWYASPYTGGDGLYAEATSNGTNWSVVIVSTNIGASAKVGLANPELAPASCQSVETWASPTNVTDGPCAPDGAYSVPAQSVVLISGAHAEPRTYPVTFTESGLPATTPWSVTLNGSTNTTSSATVSFVVRPGTYPFSIAPVPGFVAATPSGNVTVSGAAVNQSIVFLSDARPTYSVSFTSSGLGSGLPWSLTINGSTLTTANTSLEFFLANGSYPYVVGPPIGFTATPANGTISVTGSPSVQRIVFNVVQVPVPVIASNSGGGTTAGNLPTVEQDALFAGLVGVAVAAILGILIFERRRRPEPPEIESPLHHHPSVPPNAQDPHPGQAPEETDPTGLR